ncbi:ATP-binding protein [Streptomyces eurocidicus]|uniref:Anti-sigma regulatory factor (Ser/Thr protein kinase) n=1 Tax=Streptomyces eurocidicus TaxID=66423 RepID=A0A7W8B6S5_STREU|nr:ATP-binding protein [Streptomyces eurocidicus]MBB5117428.1 anti-sigma regulatory factor (Ser/Thr protein kinase) [Streptomyces eurocidicus]
MATVSAPPPWTYTLELPHDPRAPGIARATLRAVLDGHGMGELSDTAELLASELVTNAYEHTDGPSSLRLRGLEGRWIRVSVWDSSPDVPGFFGAEEAGLEAGRGLLLVRRCASTWGSHRFDPERFGAVGGKTLWFELSAPAGEPRGSSSVSPLGCGECVHLDAERRRLVADEGGEKAVDAGIAVRRHFRSAHLLPKGAVW